MTSLDRQLRGYRLTTAEILYHLPDHPALLQSFTWQYLDMAPRFPELRRFLDFWTRDIDAVLHSVKVGAVELVQGAELSHRRHELTLH
ncbi:MAG: Usg family protein [Pseudomonadota bacterium]